MSNIVSQIALCGRSCSFCFCQHIYESACLPWLSRQYVIKVLDLFPIFCDKWLLMAKERLVQNGIVVLVIIVKTICIHLEEAVKAALFPEGCLSQYLPQRAL